MATQPPITPLVANEEHCTLAQSLFMPRLEALVTALEALTSAERRLLDIAWWDAAFLGAMRAAEEARDAVLWQIRGLLETLPPRASALPFLSLALQIEALLLSDDPDEIDALYDETMRRFARPVFAAASPGARALNALHRRALRLFELLVQIDAAIPLGEAPKA